MQVSQELLWSMMRKNNSFIVKTKTLTLTKDPFSANNQHSRRNLGLVADGNRVGVSAGTGNKAFKAGKKLRNYNFASESLNDKNAANKYSAACPVVRRRIGKLHRASCKALRATKATA